MKIGVLTGGGDCPGLNSVLYGILLKVISAGHSVIGIEKGWKGFLENKTQNMSNINDFDDLHTIGGTLLYTSRTNPYKDAKKIKNQKEREEAIKKVALEMTKQLKVLDLDSLIAIGGDDTLRVAAAMHKFGNANVIGVPKT